MSDDPFVTHRSLLFTVAYEMLGSAADAEDVVQETWVRWADVDQAEVRDPRAYLVRIVTRQALNRLRTVARRREEYVGEWLPEPLLTSPRRGRGRRARRERLDRDAHRARDARPGRARGVRAARGLRHAIRRDRGGRRQERGRGAADRPPRARARRRAQTAHVGEPRRAARRRWSGSERRSQPATSRACSTYSRPTWCWWPTAAAWSPRPSARCPGRRRWRGCCRGFTAARTAARVSRRPGSTARPRCGSTPAGEFDSAVSLTVEGGRITRIYAIRNPHKLTGLDRVTLLTR